MHVREGASLRPIKGRDVVYRIDSVLFVAEFLCSLWSRDQNTFENSVYLLTVSVCRRLGLLPLGLSERAVALICPLDWVLAVKFSSCGCQCTYVTQLLLSLLSTSASMRFPWPAGDGERIAE
jgi:hypothetical protein